MGAEGLEHGVRQCSHPEDEALHAEVLQWVQAWARRIHDECPRPMGPEEWGEHEEHEMHAIDKRIDDIGASRPAHFKGCALVSRRSIQDALFFGLHGKLRGWPQDPPYPAE